MSDIQEWRNLACLLEKPHRIALQVCAATTEQRMQDVQQAAIEEAISAERAAKATGASLVYAAPAAEASRYSFKIEPQLADTAAAVASEAGVSTRVFMHNAFKKYAVKLEHAD